MAQQCKKPATSPDLRQRVYTCIDKLSDRATLSQASSELNFIARNLPSDSLPTFLTCILSVDCSSKSPVRVHCLNLLSLLAKTHHSSLTPHLPKIIPSLLRRLRDSDSAVRAACVSAASSLSPLGFNSLFSALIGAILSEQDANAQIGSCLCLKAAVDSAGELDAGDEAELRRVLPRMMKMVRGDGYKAKAALLGVMGSFVAANEGGVVNGRGGLVGNVVGCAVEMLSSDDWASRKAAAEVLETVALTAERESAVEFKRFCVTSLDSKRFDKVKITRETMNRALEAWRELPGGPDDDLLLSRSNSSISSKGGISPSVSRRSSFAGIETPKPKKTMTKTRSSLSDGLSSCASPSISSNNSSIVGLETPQRKKTISKSRSSLSDDSTITDSSSVSKSSYDGSETLHPKKPVPKIRSLLPDDFSTTKKTSNSKSNESELGSWKIQIASPSPLPPPVKVESEDEAQSKCKTAQVATSDKDRVQKFGGFRSGSRVVPYSEEDAPEDLVIGGGTSDEFEGLSLIRAQLLQIERQQSNLLDLIQRFMGNSQNGIDSLETRVTGLERALDEISYDLAMQSGRIPKNEESAGRSTCCPSTEFLSPKFWRKAETRSSSSKSTYSGNVIPNKDVSNLEALQIDGHRFQEQNEGGVGRDSIKTVKSISQSSHRGRTCSPRSLDVASSATFFTPVVKGA